MDENLLQWIGEQKHLPEILKDFHVQKDVFKLIHDNVDIDDIKELKDINSINAHIYVIDIFLWKMAQYGYVLKKSNAHQNFEKLEDGISKNKKIRTEILLGDVNKK